MVRVSCYITLGNHLHTHTHTWVDDTLPLAEEISSFAAQFAWVIIFVGRSAATVNRYNVCQSRSKPKFIPFFEF